MNTTLPPVTASQIDSARNGPGAVWFVAVASSDMITAHAPNPARFATSTSLPARPADRWTARCVVTTHAALAAMPVLVEYALPLLRTSGVLATPKGSRGDEELVEATRAIEALGGEPLPPAALPLPEDVPPQRVYLVRRTRPLDDRYPRRPGVPLKRPL